MILLNIKPLSINDAFKGRRFKTKEYSKFQEDILYMLPKIDIGKAPYDLSLEFGFSSKGSDLDNGIKTFLDCLSKKYGFNDNEIYFMYAKKVIVPKGKEYIKFKITTA